MSGIFNSGPKVSGDQSPFSSLSVQQSSYGTPVCIVYGTNRITGNMLQYMDFNSQQQSTGGGGGGKGGVSGGGGKGGGSSQYVYFATFAIGLCEGPISGVGQVWVSKQITDLPDLSGTLFNGTLSQSPWGYVVTNHPEDARGYNNLAYVGFQNFSLGTSSETPNISYEVNGLKVIGGGNQDAYVENFFMDFLNRAAFPSAYIGDFSVVANYCKAMGYFISPIIDQQRSAADWLTEIMATLNCEFVLSGGVLTAVPYGDSVVVGNGATYIPDLTPQYDLNDSDFIVDGDEDPITVSRKDLADAYNQQPIEYVNRADQYNIETYQAEDAGAIDMVGIRQASTVQAHHITDPSVAQTMASIILWRQLYVRATYKFKLPWNYARLDPMDLVTLTDPNLGLNRTLVRIVDISEDENGILTFDAEEMPGNIAAPALYQQTFSSRYTPNYNTDAGAINAPIFFEEPLAYEQAAAVTLAIVLSSSDQNWGGTDVWVSTDGESYQFLKQINGSAIQGVLSSDLPNFIPTDAVNIDQINTLAINLTESAGVLQGSATTTDATSLNTICYVDGEIIAYGADELTGSNTYNLTYLNRGCYGTPITAHASGAPFARLNASVVSYDVDQTRIGQTLYFKFVSFNVWGGGQEQLANVPAYPYVVLGTALITPLADITSLTANYSNNIAQLNWTPITDIRSPILYEIRKGSSWGGGQFIGRALAPTFAVYGSDTYYVSPLYLTPLGMPVYSANPIALIVDAPSIPVNTVDDYDEKSTGWSGTLGGSAVLIGDEIVVGASTNLLADTNLLAIPDIYADIAEAFGSYTAPDAHTISSTYIASARVVISWAVNGVNLSGAGDVTAIPDVTAVTDMIDAIDQPFVYAIPQIKLSQDGTVFGDWQNWNPGTYTFKAIKFQILIYSTNTQVEAVLTEFSYEVDVDQLIQHGTATTLISGATTISYPSIFNIVPTVIPAIIDQQEGDTCIITGVDASTFSLEVLSSGSPVVRNVSWTATGW